MVGHRATLPSTRAAMPESVSPDLTTYVRREVVDAWEDVSAFCATLAGERLVRTAAVAEQYSYSVTWIDCWVRSPESLRMTLSWSNFSV